MTILKENQDFWQEHHKFITQLLLWISHVTRMPPKYREMVPAGYNHGPTND